MIYYFPKVKLIWALCPWRDQQDELNRSIKIDGSINIDSVTSKMRTTDENISSLKRKGQKYLYALTSKPQHDHWDYCDKACWHSHRRDRLTNEGWWVVLPVGVWERGDKIETQSANNKRSHWREVLGVSEIQFLTKEMGGGRNLLLFVGCLWPKYLAARPANPSG